MEPRPRLTEEDVYDYLDVLGYTKLDTVDELRIGDILFYQDNSGIAWMSAANFIMQITVLGEVSKRWNSASLIATDLLYRSGRGDYVFEDDTVRKSRQHTMEYIINNGQVIAYYFDEKLKSPELSVYRKEG